MKKLLGILVLGFFGLSGCIKHTPAGPDPELGEYGKFIKVQTIKEFNKIYSNVFIMSVTPKNIIILSTIEWVSLQEISNLAQYHCQKTNLDAILLPPPEEEDEDSIYRKNNFICQ
jgi:hypothetical protein